MHKAVTRTRAQWNELLEWNVQARQASVSVNTGKHDKDPIVAGRAPTAIGAARVDEAMTRERARRYECLE